MRVKAEFIFPGKLQDEAIICFICKKFNITLSILEASFSTDTGWAILTIEGEEGEIKKSFEFLNKDGVEIQNLQQIS